MAGRGAWQRALDVRADTPYPGRIDEAAHEWRAASRILSSAADALMRHAADTERIGGRSGPAIRTTFEATAERMAGQARSLDKGAAALARANGAVLAARAGRGSDEPTARGLVEAVDDAFREAAAALAEIHGSTTPAPAVEPAEPPGTPPGLRDPRPSPASARAPVPDRGQPKVGYRATNPEIDPVDHPDVTTRPEVATAAPPVLGAPAPAAAPASHAEISHPEISRAGTVAGLTAGGLLALSGPAVLHRRGITTPTGVRPIGSDGRTGASTSLVPGSPVARSGGRSRGAVAPAAGTALGARGKRRAKRIRLRTRRIGRRGREDG